MNESEMNFRTRLFVGRVEQRLAIRCVGLDDQRAFGVALALRFFVTGRRMISNRLRGPHVGVPQMSDLENKPWGMLEFYLIDPNGSLLRVGQEIDDSFI